MILATPRHQFNYGNVAVTVFHAAAGEGLPMHEHEYAHATVCCAGEIIIRQGGKEISLTKASRPVNLQANVQHEIEAVQDETVFINIAVDEPRG